MQALIIEDEVAIALALGDMLERLGFKVRYAMSLREAVELAATTTPDAIFTDLRLPDGDGREAIATIRQARADVPVVFVTASPVEIDPTRRETLVRNPFGFGDIAAAVADLAIAPQTRRRVPREDRNPHRPERSASQPQPAQMQQGRRTTDDDEG
jgi:CheY-like chemotaxis protein